MCSVMHRACLARGPTAIRTFPGPTLTSKGWRPQQPPLALLRRVVVGRSAYQWPPRRRGLIIRTARLPPSAKGRKCLQQGQLYAATSCIERRSTETSRYARPYAWFSGGTGSPRLAALGQAASVLETHLERSRARACERQLASGDVPSSGPGELLDASGNVNVWNTQTLTVRRRHARRSRRRFIASRAALSARFWGGLCTDATTKAEVGARPR
jgi:hypothetical protein